tara:strand:- start:273 stop:2171 length:1899 start_codon:yes stop_codon:yes gene_type:complete
MSFAKLDFRAGINKEETDYSNEGGWVDANLVRFRKNRVEKIGGWLKSNTNTLLGKARALHQWVSLAGTRYLGLGTTVKYYIESGGSYNDITPIRATTTNGILFAATNGSSTITATDDDHGAVTGDFVTLAGAASLGGVVTAAVLNQEYEIASVPSVDTYTFVAKDTSGDTVTANASDSGNGGSGVDGAYQVNIGLDNYVEGTGWGVSTWGSSTFGSSSSLSAKNQLRLWSHDNFGEDLVMNVRGGGLFYWTENNNLNTRAVALTALSGANLAPTVGLQVITSETDRHLIVLGADPLSSGSRTGSVDPMLIAFSDQESATEWESLKTNTAGSLRLSSGSQIVAGLKARQEILIWTDNSIYSMNFIGPPLTFSVNLINEGAGLIGPKAAVNTAKGVFFMSKTGFYYYNGAVQKLQSTVQEYVFEDLDLGQAFKCHVALNSEFSEVWFFYPSLEDDTQEISRYAIYNYEENLWSIGSLIRYAWLDTGVQNKPQATGIDGTDYYLYDHESGFNADNEPMDNVFVQSADFDFGEGDNLAFIKRIIPDIKFINELNTSQTGAVNIVLKQRDFNGSTLSTNSTNQVTATTTQSFVRARGRQFVLRFESDDDNNVGDRKNYKWRLGATRMDITNSGRRGA